jgi:dienelactone hydrolase
MHPISAQPTLRRSSRWLRVGSACLVVGLAACTSAPPAGKAPAGAPVGEVKEGADRHTAASGAAVVSQAKVALPAAATGGAVWYGAWRDLPASGLKPVPVVVFLHGSSGLKLKAIEEWQRWLATQGVASVAPDSFALPGRLTYTSPVGKAVYERIHALRGSEIDLTLAALRSAPWADAGRLLLAGTSEGAVAVARYSGQGFVGRMVYSWSCEDNYFVTTHQTAVTTLPVLNVMSSTDPYFSPSNGWLGNADARGHCGAVLAAHKQATVVLIPGAPHTLLNLPAARHATAGFVADRLR